MFKVKDCHSKLWLSTSEVHWMQYGMQLSIKCWHYRLQIICCTSECGLYPKHGAQLFLAPNEMMAITASAMGTGILQAKLQTMGNTVNLHQILQTECCFITSHMSVVSLSDPHLHWSTALRVGVVLILNHDCIDACYFQTITKCYKHLWLWYTASISSKEICPGGPQSKEVEWKDAYLTRVLRLIGGLSCSSGSFRLTRMARGQVWTNGAFL